MATLPSEAEAAVLRGVGAYLRAVPRNELPNALRSLAGRHQKMVVARKDQVLAALEDPVTRGLILQWLAEDSSLARADAKALRLGLEREPGWEEELVSSSPAKKGTTPSRERTQLSDGSEKRERDAEKAQEARAEVRRVKSESARAAKELTARIAKLESELNELRAERTQLKELLDRAQKDLARAEELRVREARKARSGIAAAEKEAAAARKELSRALRELEGATTSKAGASSSTRTPRTRASVKKSEPPARRKRLAVPQGRLADAPETLRAWLDVDHVGLLVDGYNVAKAPRAYGELALETQRERVIDGVAAVARRYDVPATIVFDGSDVGPGTKRRKRGPVAIEYSRPDEIADDHLIARLERLPNYPVIVVTNDRELQHRAAALGATIATSDQLLALF